MEKLDWEGRVAIVTGAGRGLGRAHAIALAGRGARVVVNDFGGTSADGSAEESPARDVVDEIVAAGREAVADFNSVATPEGGEAVVQTALDAFGGVDVLVNNAGILRDVSFAKASPEMIQSVLDVHLGGSFWVTRAAWPVMRDRRYGRIVFTSSMGGWLGNFGQSNYGAAKMGLIGLMRALAVEGQRYGVLANAIAPAAYTRMNDSIGLPEKAKRLLPELVSPAVLFLTHESCTTNGEVLTVGGGRVARLVIGETDGIFEADLSPEDIVRRWEEIASAGFSEPRSVEEGFELFWRHLT